MKLSEMQKIWDSKTNQTLYVMDEKAVEKIVKIKAHKANKKAAYVENFIIVINLIVPIILFLLAYMNDKTDFGEYAIGIFMFLTVVLTFNYKRRRINSQKNSGKSMLDALEHAIHNATYQAQMTNIFLTWYILGVGLLTVINLIIEKTNIWLILMISFIFAVGMIVGRWEQSAWHDKQRDDLIALRDKLVSE
jgi:hypothetical protein